MEPVIELMDVLIGIYVFCGVLLVYFSRIGQPPFVHSVLIYASMILIWPFWMIHSVGEPEEYEVEFDNEDDEEF